MRSDHILVVDDDPDIRQLLATYLKKNGYQVTLAEDGQTMHRLLAHQAIDLVVLDLMLPGEDGLTLCRELRTRTALPVIMLTARGGLVDRIVGLEMGADDYLAKPFDPRELLARIRVVLKRTRSFPPQSAPDDATRLGFAGWELDVGAGLLRSPKGVTIALAGSDARLLQLLLNHPNQALGRDFLLQQVFQKERMPFDRAIDVCISRLRQHLGDPPRSPRFIQTVRNQGYRLTVDAVERR
ncbi:response regulator [Halomonas sp. HNIBRBA4712]|uniref:response regulator n=1 Tax=Halomonas sp. HNIBRBA4712 TaxID=3373087 RepID=UPI0037450F08